MQNPYLRNAYIHTYILTYIVCVFAEKHRVSLDWDKKRVGDFFKTNYEWDLLTARSIWAFGPEKDGVRSTILSCTFLYVVVICSFVSGVVLFDVQTF